MQVACMHVYILYTPPSYTRTTVQKGGRTIEPVGTTRWEVVLVWPHQPKIVASSTVELS